VIRISLLSSQVSRYQSAIPIRLPRRLAYAESVRIHRLCERAAYCFSDSLGKPTRAGKRRPCQNVDESFFALIFTEDVVYECFIHLIRCLRKYERQPCNRPILSSQHRGLRVHPASAERDRLSVPVFQIADYEFPNRRRGDK